jgi:hypothetical protein
MLYTVLVLSQLLDLVFVLPFNVAYNRLRYEFFCFYISDCIIASPGESRLGSCELQILTLTQSHLALRMCCVFHVMSIVLL